ncbi:hypothetical protein BVC80_7473g2 [Macleaya cordata]|uniref:Reverse transcriptase zinc-binding domain n=1 Tax=Macleaya cordata TaxID=56857 RepID=A0A200PT83_MACCD|nr:hypothetical protein BVC80_7473g2 [Macleaya cordata]
MAKYTKSNGFWITYYKKSSTWAGIRWVIDSLHSNTRWIVGNERTISLWKENWISNQSILESLNIQNFPFELISKLSEIIHDGVWVFPTALKKIQLYMGVDPESIPNPMGGSDRRIWPHNLNGNFTVTSAYNILRNILRKSIIPRISS